MGENNKVTVVEMMDTIGCSVYYQHLDDIMVRLDKKKVQFITSFKVMKIDETTTRLINTKDSSIINLKADAVVFAIGNMSNRRLYNELSGEFPDTRIIGDARKPGTIADAIRDGFFVATE